MSRTIVQLSCRPCDAGEVVHQALQENDVTFHLVTKHKVIMAGPDAKKREAMAKKLLGFDNKFGYTVRGEKLIFAPLNFTSVGLQGSLSWDKKTSVMVWLLQFTCSGSL